MNTFKQDILKKIQSGEVDMKPRWHFMLRGALLLFGVLTVALLIIYLLSFVLFILRQSGVGFVPLYGLRGVSLFVMNSPWLLIACAGVSLAALQLLVHKYSFSYRQPLLYSVIGLIVLVLFGAYAIGQTQVHPRLQGIAEGRNVPVISALYSGAQNRPENILVGTITELSEQGFVLASDKGEVLSVVLTEQTTLRKQTVFSVNDTVLVFGDRKDQEITAIGVRSAPENFDIKKFKGRKRDGDLIRQNNLNPIGDVR